MAQMARAYILVEIKKHRCLPVFPVFIKQHKHLVPSELSITPVYRNRLDAPGERALVQAETFLPAEPLRPRFAHVHAHHLGPAVRVHNLGWPARVKQARLARLARPARLGFVHRAEKRSHCLLDGSSDPCLYTSSDIYSRALRPQKRSRLVLNSICNAACVITPCEETRWRRNYTT